MMGDDHGNTAFWQRRHLDTDGDGTMGVDDFKEPMPAKVRKIER